MNRDRIIEGALKHELRDAGPLSDNCVDAEVLAAWQDGGLDQTTVARVEAHVSTCARCQAMLATSLRGQSGHQAIGPSEAVGPDRLAFWKWLTPLAAGAAAVTIWMVIPEQREVALAPPAAPAASPAASASARPESDELRRDPALPAPPASPARKDTAAPKEEKARAESAIAETVTVESSSPVVPAPAPAAEAQTAVAGLRARAQFAAAPFEIVSPDAKQRWRISPAGIERSVDIGGTWSLVRAAAGEVLVAGASPSPGVCWLIGNNGVVLLTTNGTVFTRVDIPTGDDLRSITATDARSATVVNASGRSFTTVDGGLTWR